MKTMTFVFSMLLSIILHGQTYNTNIKEAENVVIKKGNVTIGQLIINEEANRAKIFLDTIIQFRDSFSIWHTIITFKSLDTNPMFPAFIKFGFNSPIINILRTFQGVAQTSMDVQKTQYVFLSTTVSYNPFTFIVNSEKREIISLTGVLGKLH